MDAYAQRRINDRDGLTWLAKFGWLRTTELGPLLWPGNSTARQQADRLARSWLERRLVLARELPERAGRALVLATAGVRLLAEFGVEAASGKGVGQVTGEEWRPPLTWRHDMLAAGVLVELHRRGYEVTPEAHIRRHAGPLVKVPDGLARRGPNVLWLEVEAARKTGRAMRELADALCAVAACEAAPVMGLRPTHALVAYRDDDLDERGRALSHRVRVRAAVAAAAKDAVPLMWARCTLRGPAGVGAVAFESETVPPSGATRVRQALDANGWRLQADGCLGSHYGSHRASVCEEENGWSYQVNDQPANYAASLEAAKRACASAIAAL